MKKIIFLFLIFSVVVFAKWEVGTDYTTGGDYPVTTFITYDDTNEAYVGIGVNVDGTGFSVVTIHISYKIKKEDDLVLIITDNEGNNINCHFHSDDLEDYYIKVPSRRSTVLTKMLYNGQSAILKNTDTDEILATFDLRGIKEIMQKHVGSSYWYKYKLND
ncbi:hypothetical protein [Brachyspira catarrhinii]|uniref:Uncharacterized protein n=1 Tax=Brachyspira catarrhinii TaxID=2528966 RepID=A0ABY2TTT7_9SPIR|nr:hypothetical protein [Brachyspira catarrhinii]TKZ36166.1 hypothetical protein EZH24_01440 [Brachyspira catarrhinii]